jgi:hypothetical protein
MRFTFVLFRLFVLIAEVLAAARYRINIRKCTRSLRRLFMKYSQTAEDHE